MLEKKKVLRVVPNLINCFCSLKMYKIVLNSCVFDLDDSNSMFNIFLIHIIRILGIPVAFILFQTNKVLHIFRNKIILSIKQKYLELDWLIVDRNNMVPICTKVI